MIMEITGEGAGTVGRAFATRDEAIAAIRALQAAGFTLNEISVIARDQAYAGEIAGDTGTRAEEGAAGGAVAGGVLGAVVAVLAGASAVAIPGLGLAIAGPLAGALAGAAGGGLAGGLIGAGIPDAEARHYADRVQQGDVLVTVAAGGRDEEARRILNGVDDTVLDRPTLATDERLDSSFHGG